MRIPQSRSTDRGYYSRGLDAMSRAQITNRDPNSPIGAGGERRLDHTGWMALGVVLLFFVWSLAGGSAVHATQHSHGSASARLG